MSIPLTNQWNDFLLRKSDPYALAKYEVLLKWLGSVSGQTCLIVGSGSGELAAMLARAGAKVLATDIDAASVDLTQSTSSELGVQIQTQVARLEDLPLEPKFDIVVATDVIEHIENDQAAAVKLSQLVAPQGRLVITVPALQFLFGYHDVVLGHFRRYSCGQVRTLFAPFFKIERLRYFGFFLIPVTLMFSRIMKKPYPVAAVGNSAQGQSLAGRIIRFLFRIEKSSAFPLGTSVLLLATPNVKP